MPRSRAWRPCTRCARARPSRSTFGAVSWAKGASSNGPSDLDRKRSRKRQTGCRVGWQQPEGTPSGQSNRRSSPQRSLQRSPPPRPRPITPRGQGRALTLRAHLRATTSPSSTIDSAAIPALAPHLRIGQRRHNTRSSRIVIESPVRLNGASSKPRGLSRYQSSVTGTGFTAPERPDRTATSGRRPALDDLDHERALPLRSPAHDAIFHLAALCYLSSCRVSRFSVGQYSDA